MKKAGRNFNIGREKKKNSETIQQWWKVEQQLSRIRQKKSLTAFLLFSLWNRFLQMRDDSPLYKNLSFSVPLFHSLYVCIEGCVRFFPLLYRFCLFGKNKKKYRAVAQKKMRLCLLPERKVYTGNKLSIKLLCIDGLMFNANFINTVLPPSTFLLFLLRIIFIHLQDESFYSTWSFFSVFFSGFISVFFFVLCLSIHKDSLFFFTSLKEAFCRSVTEYLHLFEDEGGIKQCL